jgi:hypothetical protein
MNRHLSEVNSKIILRFGMFVVAFFLITGCNKKPQADFTTDKEEYTAGEIIRLTNKSIHAKSYNWLFPDLSASTSENPEYALSADLADGSYPIRLESLRNSETSLITKFISVIAQKGQLTVWTSDTIANGPYVVQVFIDNNFIGHITSRYSSDPGCGATGCVTVNLKTGSHKIIISNSYNNNVRSETLMINRNTCSTFQLPKK